MIPPYFDRNNYAYWKVRMKAFLKSLDEKAWLPVEVGWENLPHMWLNGLMPKKKQLALIARQ